VLDGADGVERIVDELDPVDSARWLAQASAPARPLWAPSFGAALRPFFAGNGTSQWLQGSPPMAAVLGSGPVTSYLCAVGGGSGTRQPAGAGASASGDMARHRLAGTAIPAVQVGAVAVAVVADYSGVAYWAELTHDGAQLSYFDSSALSAGPVAVVPQTTDVASVCARVSFGSPQQFDASAMLWWFGFSRALSPAEKTIARAACSAWIAGP
jgi:hypothetical protein